MEVSTCLHVACQLRRQLSLNNSIVDYDHINKRIKLSGNSVTQNQKRTSMKLILISYVSMK